MKRDLKKGAIRDMLVVLADKSRIAALDGKREDGNKTEMTHAFIRPAAFAKKDPRAHRFGNSSRSRLFTTRSANHRIQGRLA